MVSEVRAHYPSQMRQPYIIQTSFGARKFIYTRVSNGIDNFYIENWQYRSYRYKLPYCLSNNVRQYCNTLPIFIQVSI